MTQTRAGCLAAALTMAACAVVLPAAAQQGPGNASLIALLAPEPGNKACYQRSYDAAHLKAHPQQRITAMTFMLRVAAYDPKEVKAERPEDRVYYTFAMSVARRGDKRLLRTAGDCTGDGDISCVVDCDGGSVKLDKAPPAGSLIVRFSDDDGIQMFHDCDGGEAVLVKAGSDDKVFRLDKSSNESCRALEKKMLGD